MLSKYTSLRNFLKLFLFIGLAGICLLTAVGYISLTMLTKTEAQSKYEKQTRQITNRIGERMEYHANILYRARAFLLVDKTPTEAEWQTYFGNQEIFQQDNGVDAIAFSRYMTGSRKDIEKQLLNDHEVAMKITPEGERSEYVALTLVASVNPAAPKAFGFDLLSEPVRKAAIENSRISNAPTITSPVSLVPDGRQAVIMVLPVFIEGDQLYGFISAVYYTDSFMTGVLDTNENSTMSTAIIDTISHKEVYKTKTAVKGASITRSDALDMSGREWSVNYAAPSTSFGDGHLIPYMVLTVGTVFIIVTLFSARVILKLTDRVESKTHSK